MPRRTIHTKDTDINFVREDTGNVPICIHIIFLSRANNEAIMMGGGLSILRTYRIVWLAYTKAGVGT